MEHWNRREKSHRRNLADPRIPKPHRSTTPPLQPSITPSPRRCRPLAQSEGRGDIVKKRCFMPTYEFECKNCGHEFSRVMTVDEHDKEPIRCPKCESEDVRHVIESVNVTTSRKS